MNHRLRILLVAAASLVTLFSGLAVVAASTPTVTYYACVKSGLVYNVVIAT